MAKPLVRKITLPKTGIPGKYSRGGKKVREGKGLLKTPKAGAIGYKEPSVRKVGTVRKKGESLKAFRVRTLKKFFKEHCGSDKWCYADTISEMDRQLKGKTIEEIRHVKTKEEFCETRNCMNLTKKEVYKEIKQSEVMCGVCPTQKASDDVWIRWGEYYGFRFDLNDTKKKGTITIIKEKVKGKVIAKVVPDYKEITTIPEWERYGVNIRDYTETQRVDAQNIDYMVMRGLWSENLTLDDLKSLKHVKTVGKVKYYNPWEIGPIPEPLMNAIISHTQQVSAGIVPTKPKTADKVVAKVKAKVEKKVEAKPKPTPAPKVPYVEEHPELKKKPKPKPIPTPKPAPKKVVKKAVKPKPAPKPKAKPKKTLKGTKLTAKQKKHLKDQGYVNITHNKKKYRITPSRVKRGILLR